MRENGPNYDRGFEREFIQFFPFFLTTWLSLQNTDWLSDAAVEDWTLRFIGVSFALLGLHFTGLVTKSTHYRQTVTAASVAFSLADIINGLTGFVTADLFHYHFAVPVLFLIVSLYGLFGLYAENVSFEFKSSGIDKWLHVIIYC